MCAKNRIIPHAYNGFAPICFHVIKVAPKCITWKSKVLLSSSQQLKASRCILVKFVSSSLLTYHNQILKYTNVEHINKLILRTKSKSGQKKKIKPISWTNNRIKYIIYATEAYLIQSNSQLQLLAGTLPLMALQVLPSFWPVHKEHQESCCAEELHHNSSA